MTDISVINFRKRREERLAKRGYNIKKNEYRKTKDDVKVEKPMKAAVREDAPEEEEQNNGGGGGSKSGGGSGGGHGNTRLPYGLCQRFGITIEPDWSPKDAWDALAGKGITPEGAFARLKQGKDPGTPSKNVEPEVPKEPKKTMTDERGRVVKDIKLAHVYWDKDSPYYLRGEYEEGGGPYYRWFGTKTDMLMALKEAGVEEIQDPENGEMLNPSAMEFPKYIMMESYGGEKRFTSVSAGVRGGKYILSGIDMEGKKRKIAEYATMAGVRTYLEEKGVSESDVKMSPKLKKTEKERTAWVGSDKKEYIEDNDVKYGDLKATSGFYGYSLIASSEEGAKITKRFKGKTSLMKYLKEQGVERAKVDDEYVNPQEFVEPKKVATIDGNDYQEIKVTESTSEEGAFIVYGIDMDGGKHGFLRSRSDETYNEFMQRCKDRYGISDDILTIDDDTKSAIEKRIKQDEETERRKKEFESKAIEIAGDRYVDVELIADDWGEYRLIGYDKDGKKQNVTFGEKMHNICRIMETYGVNADSVIKDPNVREAYDKYQEQKRKFEAEAEDFGGGKYINVGIESSAGGHYLVIGKDIGGSRRVIIRSDTPGDLKDQLNMMGKSFEDIPMDEDTKLMYERDKKIEEAMSSGEYHRLKGSRGVYKDIYISEEHSPILGSTWTITGTDVDGQEVEVYNCSTYDDALELLESKEIMDYKVRIGDKEHGRPVDGMRKPILMRTADGFKIMATVGKGEVKEVASSATEEEARKWLRDNNIDDTQVRTRGMNPNDDVPRVHSAKSLSKFDSYRMAQVEGSIIEDLTSEEKQLTADMLAEVYKNGALRAVRGLDNFGNIIEYGYKSQIETGTAGRGACLSKAKRKRCSDVMYGHGGLMDSEYEKCGYLGYQDETDEYEDGYHPFYGPMTFTFRKETMKDRVTYTFGDSLNSDYNITSAGYMGEKPTIEGMTTFYSASPIRAALAEYRRYKNGETSYKYMFDTIRDDADNNYIECQFHGKVTAADIETASFESSDDLDEAFGYMDDEQKKRVVKIIEDNGINLIYMDSSGNWVDGLEYVKKKYT